MANKAISADVKAANSKLAIHLRKREEEEMLIQIGKRKPKKQIEEKLPGGVGRWNLEPNYTAPTPMVDRPRTLTGATSFHFSYITISKEAVPTVGGKPVEGSFGKAKQAALEHSKYIERDGAAEVSQGAEHAAYVERPDAVESIDPSGLIREGIERTIATVINETPTDEEASVMGAEQEPIEGIPSVFSNISDDPFERQEFWRVVERCERQPKAHQIILDPTITPRWWEEIETSDKIDSGFKNHALMVAEKYRQHLAAPSPENGKRPYFVADPYTVSAEKAGKLIQQAQQMRHYDPSMPPFKFESGRGGRVQIRFVAELPHELTAEDRALIVQNFCDKISSLEERKEIDGTTRKVGMMYTAVIHAPDTHNDSRNYHLHIVAYDRPCRFMDEAGMWDFEIQETFRRPGSGSERVRYPFRQDKIGEVARPKKDGSDYDKAGKNFIPTLRAEFARINNVVLKARGIQRKLDPRRYTEMGIDRTPTEHLGTKAAALEAIGIPTTKGQINAIAIWDDAERAISRQANAAGKAHKASQQQLDQIARGVTAIDPCNPVLASVRSLMVERARIIADVSEDRASIMTFDHMEAKAKSRVIRTRQTCLQFLADIENGKADRTTKVMKRAIQERWQSAQNHINQIDKDLSPHREALARAARNIETSERRLFAIDTALEPIKSVLERRIEQGGPMVAPTPSVAPVVAPVPATPAPTTAPSVDPDLAARNTGTTAATPLPSTKAPTSLTRPVDVPVDPADPAPAEPAEEEKTSSVPVEPVSIEGIPLVRPTIAPRQDIPFAETDVDLSTPDGLSPLRPINPPTPIAALETIIDNIDQPGPQASSDIALPTGQSKQSNGVERTRGASGGLPEAQQEEASATTQVPATVVDQAAPGPIEPKVDGRKKKVEPALFELGDQDAPIKPGTAKAEHADWESLMLRIVKTRIPIKVEKLSIGNSKFTVPSLDQPTQRLLHATRFSKRTNSRLGAMHAKQQEEVARLVRWVKQAGTNPDALVLENRTAKLGWAVRDAARTLFHHWRAHTDVVVAIREESDRRAELAKQVARQPIKEVAPIDHSAQDRREEAARIYPTADQAHTAEVREFITLLRDGAPKDKLQEAADKIHADPIAREDIQRHTVELATAYHNHIEGYDQRVIRGRDGKGGR